MTEDKRPMVSIITKAYNVECYIKECAESVLNQSFGDFEWILLENGSTDRTKEILEEYAAQDSRIKLFLNKENYIKLEPSKEGYYSYFDLLDEVRGKYITELDSDDYWDVDYLKTLCAVAEEKKADIVAAGSYYVMDDGVSKELKKGAIPKAFDDPEIAAMGNDLFDFYNTFSTVWGKLISTEFYMENLKYIYDRPFFSYGGDTLTALRMLQVARSCVCVEKPLYFYRNRMSSTSKVNQYYNRELHLAHDAVFREGLRLVKSWNKNNEKCLIELFLIHMGGIKECLSMIANVTTLTLQEKLVAIEEVLSDDIYREYIGLLSDANRIVMEGDIDKALDEIYDECVQWEASDVRYFYLYNFSRRYISKKRILSEKNGDYDNILYVVSASSVANSVAHENELAVYFLSAYTGAKCTTLEEARAILQEYTNTETREYENKLQLSNHMADGFYEEVKADLEKFGNDCLLDADVLYARAWVAYAEKQVETAMTILAIASELYPQEEIVKSSLEEIVVTK